MPTRTRSRQQSPRSTTTSKTASRSCGEPAINSPSCAPATGSSFPPEVADYLDDLRELGISERQIHLERDGWILMQTASPEDASLWIAEKRELITDPEFRALYLEQDAAYDWSPNDPRLPALADRTRNWFGNHYSRSQARPVHNPTIARLAVQSQPGASSPAWDRLTQLTKD
jgi:hypothetical protein